MIRTRCTCREPPAAKWTVVLGEGEDTPRAREPPSVEAEARFLPLSWGLPSTLGREGF